MSSSATPPAALASNRYIQDQPNTFRSETAPMGCFVSNRVRRQYNENPVLSLLSRITRPARIYLGIQKRFFLKPIAAFFVSIAVMGLMQILV
ncbi:hypothetical protein J3A73_003501 [Rhizobium sp. PvP099]|nr:hypothetical protein [Rhizobium sp. PvP099]